MASTNASTHAMDYGQRMATSQHSWKPRTVVRGPDGAGESHSAQRAVCCLVARGCQHPNADVDEWQPSTWYRKHCARLSRSLRITVSVRHRQHDVLKRDRRSCCCRPWVDVIESVFFLSFVSHVDADLQPFRILHHARARQFAGTRLVSCAYVPPSGVGCHDKVPSKHREQLSMCWPSWTRCGLTGDEVC